MLKTDYNTTVKTPETRALELLRQAGFSSIQQLDWIARKDGMWMAVEVKAKPLFTPGHNFPHYGAGLNKSQLFLRTQLFKSLDIRTFLLVFIPGTDTIYGAFLDELEKKGGYYDTPSHIRIYPIDNFKAINNAPNQNLGGLI